MHPILFKFGNWPVYSYGVLLALAYLAGLQLAVVRARRMGLDGAKVMDLGIYLIIAALVGAKLMLIAVDFNYFRTQPRELMSLVRAGGVFYGGLLAAFAVAIVLVRRYQLPLWPTADAIAPGIAVGHIVGRFGCLLAGCCYGAPTLFPIALVFTDYDAGARPLGVPLHATQIYELVGCVLIAAALLRWRPAARGHRIGVLAVAYGLLRFLLEFLRGDERGEIARWPTTQLAALVLVMIALLAIGHRKPHAIPSREAT